MSIIWNAFLSSTLVPFAFIGYAELMPVSGAHLSNLVVNAVVGDTVTLACAASQPVASFNWLFYSTPSQIPTEVCINGGLINGFKERYNVPNYSTGNYSLTITNVRLNESGGYVCRENNGFGPDHYLQLIVSDISRTTIHQCTPCTSSFVNSLTPSREAPLCCTDSGRPDSSETLQTVLFVVLPLAGLLLGITSTICIGLVTACLIGPNCLLCRNFRRLMNSPKDDSTNEEKSYMLQDPSCDHTFNVDIGLHGTEGLYELMMKPETFRKFVNVFVNRVRSRYPDVEVIIGFDTHGFTFALLTAHMLNKPFVAVRKLKPLVGDVIAVKYESRNETGQMYMLKNACRSKQKVVIIDEKLASGGTLKCVGELMEKLGVEIIGCEVLFEDRRHKGRELLAGTVIEKKLVCHITYPPEPEHGGEQETDALTADCLIVNHENYL